MWKLRVNKWDNKYCKRENCRQFFRVLQTGDLAAPDLRSAWVHGRVHDDVWGINCQWWVWCVYNNNMQVFLLFSCVHFWRRLKPWKETLNQNCSSQVCCALARRSQGLTLYIWDAFVITHYSINVAGYHLVRFATIFVCKQFVIPRYIDYSSTDVWYPPVNCTEKMRRWFTKQQNMANMNAVIFFLLRARWIFLLFSYSSWKVAVKQHLKTLHTLVQSSSKNGMFGSQKFVANKILNIL